MKEIKLTQGKVALVDDADFEWLNQWKWHAHFNTRNQTWEARRHLAAVRAPGTKNRWRAVSRTMHRELMGEKAGFTPDHRNRDPLDNQRGNLRWATRQQQSQNRMRPNKCGFKGVFRNGRKFSARITPTRGKRLFLGLFATPEAAGRAYNDAARAHFGEFACLNPV